MANKRRSSWEEPEIEEWFDEYIEWEQEPNTRNERQLFPFVLGLGLGLGFGCRPRRNCSPRFDNCRPFWYCHPRRWCFPRPCFPL